MREYKFRAWDKTHNEMIEWEQYKDEMVSNDFWDEDLVVMEWTGAKDINGQEIYEGDILKIGLDWFLAVYHLNETQAFMLKDLDEKYSKSLNYMSQFETYNFTIVGNIFENKELLEDEN